jgi:hypothetical protein
MKVLAVTQSYYPFVDRGGPAVKVRALARGMASRGEAVTVLTADLGLARITSSVNRWARENGGWRSLEDSVETIYLDSKASYRAMTWNPGVFGFCKDRLPMFDISTPAPVPTNPRRCSVTTCRPLTSRIA